jgi:Protein of unknown function (DUF3097)
MEREPGTVSGPFGLDPPRRRGEAYPSVEAVSGLPVQHRASGLTGIVIDLRDGFVTVRDRQGHDCPMRVLPGSFVVDGQPVTLVPARTHPSDRGQEGDRPTTASGSMVTTITDAGDAQAPSRLGGCIVVQGAHAAEVVETVWGDDLRAEGITVERIDRIADLNATVRRLRPGPDRRLGVLLDQLVAGTKESQAADLVRSDHVMVAGTPYVLWPHLLRSIRTYADLDATLVGAVEQLIDFITQPAE